jgi:hypothetical protein
MNCTFYQTNESFIASYNAYKNKSNVTVLPIIDWSRVEHKADFLFLIISLIKTEYETRLNMIDCDGGANWEYKDARAALERLSDGLPGINTSVEMDSWEDPIYVMDRRLSAIRGSLDLKDNLQKYINMYLRNRKTEELVIPIYDITFNKEGFNDVYNTIYKYLSRLDNVKVITVGSIRLATKWLNDDFRKQFHKYEDLPDYTYNPIADLFLFEN